MTHSDAQRCAMQVKKNVGTRHITKWEHDLMVVTVNDGSGLTHHNGIGFEVGAVHNKR